MQRLECEIHRRERRAELGGWGGSSKPVATTGRASHDQWEVSHSSRSGGRGPSRFGPARRCFSWVGWGASKFGALLYWWCQSLIISDPAAFLLIQRRVPLVPPGRATRVDLSIFISARPSFLPFPSPRRAPFPSLRLLILNITWPCYSATLLSFFGLSLNVVGVCAKPPP